MKQDKQFLHNVNKTTQGTPITRLSEKEDYIRVYFDPNYDVFGDDNIVLDQMSSYSGVEIDIIDDNTLDFMTDDLFLVLKTLHKYQGESESYLQAITCFGDMSIRGRLDTAELPLASLDTAELPRAKLKKGV